MKFYKNGCCVLVDGAKMDHMLQKLPLSWQQMLYLRRNYDCLEEMQNTLQYLRGWRRPSADVVQKNLKGESLVEILR